ncbi:hypothetical protein DFH07DRAFT_778720 [Mycena maculata]|uniref:Uncharacterized protein n=1 Tax=Mycena maculata TaxID=230809 RepID=A0AAD7IBK5_9AGAR|nr:hypothetical protein DFH07DRAFT_778720 [Mycena maculata]
MEVRTRAKVSKPPEGNKSENIQERNRDLPYRLVQPVGAAARTLPASESKTERRYLEESRRAYELKAPVQRDGLAGELLERINSTEVTGSPRRGKAATYPNAAAGEGTGTRVTYRDDQG